MKLFFVLVCVCVFFATLSHFWWEIGSIETQLLLDINID